MTRLIIICLAQLHPWYERVICPHEATTASIVEERRSLLEACRANLSVGMALLKDPKSRFLNLLNAAPTIEQPQLIQMADGAAHQIGRVTDDEWCRVIEERLRYARLYVADGHHRYEAALRYRDESGSRGSEFTMLHILSAHDPGLLVLPSHHMVTGSRIGAGPKLDGFQTRDVHVVPDQIARQWQSSGEVWLVSKDRVTAVIDDSDGAGPDGSSAIAHRVMRAAWPQADHAATTTTPHADVALQAVSAGHAQGAVLTPAAEPSVVTRVADEDGLLPPKSTYFWPKPLAGLVLRSLDPPEAFGAS